MLSLDTSSTDKRFKLVDAAMKRHQYHSDALIEVLHVAQEQFGYLDNDLLLSVSHSLKLPPSWVYGVATFYHLFSLHPRGEHNCVVCLGTACYVKGAAKILSALEQALNVKMGSSSPEGRVSLQGAGCLGACGLAPIALFDGQAQGHLSVEEATQQVKGWQVNGASESPPTG